MGKEYTHHMVLYNHDLVIKWELKDDEVAITEVMFRFGDIHNFLNFISENVVRLIKDDIERYELGKS